MAKVSDHYDAVAENYFQQYQRENLYSLDDYPANYFRLQILTRQMAKSSLKSVFEVGVGEGTPLATMASLGMNVAGCDISQAMVAKARETFQSHGLSPDLIQWGDIEDTLTFAGQLKGGQFDAVIAAGVLPHVRREELALDNIGMLVRPGGKVFIEFRNKLLSLFSFNRYTKEFILDDLLRDVSAKLKDAVAVELDKRLATHLPPVREVEAGGPGYDTILAKFHNPFELLDMFRQHGYRDAQIHWYHYHPAPPMLESSLAAEFRENSIALEHENTWRGFFLCSAGVIEAVKE